MASVGLLAVTSWTLQVYADGRAPQNPQSVFRVSLLQGGRSSVYAKEFGPYPAKGILAILESRYQAVL